jgi:predicted adenylyl cyclase CyaB
MTNIEVKAICADPARVRRRLVERGVPLCQRMRQVDTYFSSPRGRLKLREIDDQEAQLIHYDRPDAAAAHASEYVISPVAEPDRLKEALTRALGVRVVVEKQRELYLWQYTRVHLDNVAGLGSFLELETVVEEQTREQAERECLEIQAALGIRPEDLVAGSYADLLTESGWRPTEAGWHVTDSGI